MRALPLGLPWPWPPERRPCWRSWFNPSLPNCECKHSTNRRCLVQSLCGEGDSSSKEVDPSLRLGASVSTCASQDLTGTTSLAALVRECALSFHQESESQQRVWTLQCTQSCEQSPGHLFPEPLAKAVTPGPQTATLLAPWVGDRQLYQPVKSPKGWVIVAVETLIGGPNFIYRLITAF